MRSDKLAGRLIMIVCVVLLVIAIVIIIKGSQRDQQRMAELTSERNQYLETRKQEKKTAEDIEESGSVYQKLAHNVGEVELLVVGDSISSGKWVEDLAAQLRTTYGVDVRVDNVSMGGNTSYAGYVRTMAQNTDVNYDLAIICFGQNDKISDLPLYYESVIRAVKKRFGTCSIISVLESSLWENAQKIQTIQMICGHYGIPVADAVASFNADPRGYDVLLRDGVHPSDEGHALYCQTVFDVIAGQVNMGAGLPNTDVAPLNADVLNYENMTWIDVTLFDKTDDMTYSWDVPGGMTGILGIDYTYVSGDNAAQIYIDGELYSAPMVTFDYDFSQRHIVMVAESCVIEKNITVKFSNADQAAGFKGFALSFPGS